MNERLNNLRNQVDELLRWKDENMRVQVPFDSYGRNTIDIVQKDWLVATGKTVSGFGTVFDVSLEVSFDGDILLFPAKLNQ